MLRLAVAALLVTAAAALTAPTPPFTECTTLPGFDLQHAHVFGDLNNDGVLQHVLAIAALALIANEN